MDWKTRLNSYLKLHGEGGYTDGEIIYAMILLFDDIHQINYSDLWGELPPFIKEGILDDLKDVHEDSWVMAPANSDGDKALKRRLLTLKEWLIRHKLLQLVNTK